MADLTKLTGIHQLYQAALTELPIAEHRPHFALAVLDCFSRYVLVLKALPTASTRDFAAGLADALEEGRKASGITTEHAIDLVTDREPIFVAQVLREYLPDSPFHCMSSGDRTFRYLGMVRRFVWALKDEEINLRRYGSSAEAQGFLDSFRRFYNFERPHQALRYRVPADLFCTRVD